MTIERKGSTTGRKIEYFLIANGVNIGKIKRTTAGGGDRMLPHARYSVWAIQGSQVESQAEAEKELIARAIRFGQIIPQEKQ